MANRLLMVTESRSFWFWRKVISPSFLIFLGAVGLGAAHAFEPDHMAAVSTFVAKKPSPRDAVMFGVKWATGHGLSLLLFGSLLYFLKSMLENQQPVLFSSGVLDRAVGVVLIGLGIWTLLQERVLKRTQTGKHRHTNQTHAHTHGARETWGGEEAHSEEAHSHEQTHSHGSLLPHRHGSLLMGMLHGAAGTGAFVVQAATAGIASSYWMVFGFTVFFSIGVLGSMGLYAGMLGGAITWGGRRGAQFVRTARTATGVLACVVGYCMLMSIDIPWVHL